MNLEIVIFYSEFYAGFFQPFSLRAVIFWISDTL